MLFFLILDETLVLLRMYDYHILHTPNILDRSLIRPLVLDLCCHNDRLASSKQLSTMPDRDILVLYGFLAASPCLYLIHVISLLPAKDIHDLF